MSCCGQKRAEQKRQPAGTPAAVTTRPGRASGRARPGDPQASAAARLNYLARNGKLFAR